MISLTDEEIKAYRNLVFCQDPTIGGPRLNEVIYVYSAQCWAAGILNKCNWKGQCEVSKVKLL